MIVRNWTVSRGRELLQVTVAGERSPSLEAEAKTSITVALAALAGAGCQLDHIVRSRIWARDAEARRLASDTRRTELAGSRRGASASFLDAARLPEHSTMMIDIIAMRMSPSASSKIIREYDKPVAPPEFVALDGMVFLSGNTDSSPRFSDQLTKIQSTIEESLQKARMPRNKVVQVSAYLSANLDLRSARQLVIDRFAEFTCPILVTTVSGFSGSEKLVEVEITGDLR